MASSGEGNVGFKTKERAAKGRRHKGRERMIEVGSKRKTKDCMRRKL